MYPIGVGLLRPPHMAAPVGPNDCTAGYMGGECHSPLHGRQKMNWVLHQKPFWARNLGSFRLRKRMGDGLYPYGDQNHAWVGFP